MNYAALRATGAMLSSFALASVAHGNALAPQEPAAQATGADVATGTAAAGSDTSSSSVLNEIVVTGARLRSEDVQGVPVAVTTLGAAALERAQISSASDLARIAPNVIVQRQLSTAAQANFFMRGFGNISNDPAVDPPIAIYVDGIYQPIASGTQLDAFGLESIDVERGPQGTLLGRNAPTGAISLTARRPTGSFGGAVEAGYERFDHKSLNGRVDIPIVKGILSANGSITYKEGGNYVRALQDNNRRKLGGEDVLAARIGLLFTPSDGVEWLVQLNGQNTKNPQTGWRDLGSIAGGPLQQIAVSCGVFGRCTPTPRYANDSGYLQRTVERDRQVSSNLKFKFDPVDLTLVTGYKTLRENDHSDVDGRPEAILDSLQARLRYKQFSQEARLSSNDEGGLDLGGRLNWIIGGFLSRYTYDKFQLFNIFNALTSNRQDGKTKSYALFGHAVFDITDQLNATVGARQSWDRKSHSYNASIETGTDIVDPRLKFRNLSLEGGLQYKFSASQQAYFRYAEGYRNGGYQGLPQGSPQAPYRPETVKTYEIGFKGDFFDKHLRTNLSLFQNDYKDLQRTAVLDPGDGTFGQFIRNAAGARVRGAELEATIVPDDVLTIGLTATYLDPKYKNFVVSLIPGQPEQDFSYFPFPFASKFTFRIAPQYQLDLAGGTLRFAGDVTYASRYYSSDVPYPLARIKGRALVNGNIRFEDATKTYSVKVYGENLTNQKFLESYTTTPTSPGDLSFFSIGQDRKPITWGVAVGYRF